jgi:hypothetical protein
MRVIGLSGVATSGKDLMCSLLVEAFEKQGKKAKRFALADELKLKLNDLLKKEFSIDIFSCSKEEKELVRPLLVSFGKIARERTQGKFWTDLLERKIKESESIDYAIVTDVRYDEFEEDEVSWVIEKMNGVLVHISRLENGIRVTPPNEDEARNDPRIEGKANFKVVWDTNLTLAKEAAFDLSNSIFLSGPEGRISK